MGILISISGALVVVAVAGGIWCISEARDVAYSSERQGQVIGYCIAAAGLFISSAIMVAGVALASVLSSNARREGKNEKQ